MMAFTMQSYFTQENLSDTRYIKWYAHYSIVTNGVYYNKELQIYPCREEDYAKFYPIDERS